MSERTPKKVSLQTIGCRLNQYETERMAAELNRFGFQRVKRGEPADLYIINTCTVTHRADADDRYWIHRAARENPHARIVVAGCYVDADQEAIENMEEVDVVITNEEKERITEILPERLPDLFADLHDSGCANDGARFEHFNRAWVKVSDGCNQRCSFCILPSVRGDLENRPVGEIIHEVTALVNSGFQEIVLTGLHLGMYRHHVVGDGVPDLASLIRLILAETTIKRIRLSSIEPQTVTPQLLEVFADAGPRLCRHLHIPLQSGSGKILRLMHRPYEPETYVRTLHMVREIQPRIVIGADVIVGFPGETDEDFRETKHLVQSGLLDYLHVFSYSERRNTPAADLPNKVPGSVTKSRNGILTKLSDRLRAECFQRQVGHVLGVIAEHKKADRGVFWGIADNYTKVKLPLDFEGGRQIVPFKVTGACDDHVVGEILSDFTSGHASRIA